MNNKPTLNDNFLMDIFDYVKDLRFNPARCNEVYSALDLLMEHSNRRIFCTGVGKSGVVANKLAISLASIGYPAHFLDPTSALHGDCGLVQDEALIVSFSNSGNTSELAALLKHLSETRKELTVLMITSGISPYADFQITMPNFYEAFNVPTKSTTAAMIIVDLLISKILENEPPRYIENSFKANHPGGNIGAAIANSQS